MATATKVEHIFLKVDFYFNKISFFAAKWSSNEEISKFTNGQQASNHGPGPGPKVWTPASGLESPSLDRKNKDYKPVNFEGNSLKRGAATDQVSPFSF